MPVGKASGHLKCYLRVGAATPMSDTVWHQRVPLARPIDVIVARRRRHPRPAVRTCDPTRSCSSSPRLRPEMTAGDAHATVAKKAAARPPMKRRWTGRKVEKATGIQPVGRCFSRGAARLACISSPLPIGIRPEVRANLGLPGYGVEAQLRRSVPRAHNSTGTGSHAPRCTRRCTSSR